MRYVEPEKRLVQTAYTLRPEQRRLLAELAAAEDMSASHFLRRLLDASRPFKLASVRKNQAEQE